MEDLVNLKQKGGNGGKPPEWSKLYKDNNFTSAVKFYKILKSNNIKATHKQVKEWIEKQSVAQVHKPILNIKNKQKFITASSPYDTYQIDLLDYQKYSKQNKGNRYILICVDIFTRKAHAEAIKTKKPIDTKTAMLKIINKQKPNVIYSDNGSEWKGVFKKMIDAKSIIHIMNEVGDHNSLGIIDRFSKTIKTEIAKHMTGNNTTNWADKLDDFINRYNNTEHSSINDIKPKDADKNENKYEIGAINYDKVIFNKKIDGEKNNFKVGDNVRIQKPKTVFKKGYEITYSKETYKIKTVGNGMAKLDDGKRYKTDRLLKVNSVIKPLGNTLEKSNAKQKAKRKLNKEGIEKQTITRAKRVRKQTDKGFYLS